MLINTPLDLVHFRFFFGGGRGGRLFEAGRLLTFPTYRVGAYSRWAFTRGWALNRINTVYEFNMTDSIALFLVLQSLLTSWTSVALYFVVTGSQILYFSHPRSDC